MCINSSNDTAAAYGSDTPRVVESDAVGDPRDGDVDSDAVCEKSLVGVGRVRVVDRVADRSLVGVPDHEWLRERLEVGKEGDP